MSYNTEIQSNNADLQEILDTVNSLPDKVNGVTPATITYYIQAYAPIVRLVYLTLLDDGTIAVVDTTDYTKGTRIQVIAGSLVYARTKYSTTASGVNIVYPTRGNNSTGFVIRMPESASDTVADAIGEV